jgi:hypothetical protein
MRSAEDVHRVFRLAEQGNSQAEIARRVGVARATVRDWLNAGETAVLSRPMRVGRATRAPCEGRCNPMQGIDEPAYAYLLGQYLGDGCISRIGGGFRLRISCCDAYPRIMAETADSIRRVVPEATVRFIPRIGCTEVYATWFHWPCLFPQHGAGVKHERRIALEPWQGAIALDAHPDLFVRGLIHSDGCRCVNRVRGANGRPYAYTRYMFCNRSADIRQLFVDACGRLGVDCRQMNRYNISVARRASVERLDEIVGPKS